ncbi:protein YIPF3 isoform X2 [Lingula anatina]|uniref:Protein YIPF3 n=1 Tax=Lingula anatina TaxID=7574 RepID=A0A1S3JGY1_LINAN|nr:protein YIPF3 isoform X2 [Lingula anatina]|eukprot:XP_013409665.1 protein YIPF3 isoform X2 [Lingula anatina]
MAARPGWQQSGQMDSSAVIDMDYLDSGDGSGHDTNESDIEHDSPDSKDGKSGLYTSMQKNVASFMFERGREQAKRAYSLYANIDFLRPYFDVEPHIVRSRLLNSMLPRKPTDERQSVPRELYGPTMLVFTMIALLLFQMKTANHAVEEGTLMGTAFGVCFGYWLGVSSFIMVLSYMCNTRIVMMQILSLLGYSLFGHCLVLFLGTVIHTSHDHMLFYLLWGTLGGLSTLKMIAVLASRTRGSSQKMVMCGIVAAIHMLFLIYLHFAYHQMVEEISFLEGVGPHHDFLKKEPIHIISSTVKQAAEMKGH